MCLHSCVFIYVGTYTKNILYMRCIGKWKILCTHTFSPTHTTFVNIIHNTCISKKDITTGL